MTSPAHWYRNEAGHLYVFNGARWVRTSEKRSPRFWRIVRRTLRFVGHALLYGFAGVLSVPVAGMFLWAVAEYLLPLF